MTSRKNTLLILTVVAPLIPLVGALVVAFSDFQWRGLIGWGLIVLGVGILLARIGMGGRETGATDSHRNPRVERDI